VRVAPVREAALGNIAETAGITAAFRVARVSAEVMARVVARRVESGARVEAGHPLIELDATRLKIALDEARATLQAREVDLAEALRELQRAEELRRQDAVSERQHDALRFQVERSTSARDLANAALRRAERELADTVVRAPFAGTVEKVDVQVGDHVAPGAPVATLTDFQRVRVLAGVTASETANIHVGLATTISIPALGAELRAPVHSIGRIADRGDGTYPVEIWVDDPEERLREGMVARLSFAAANTMPAVVVPRQALIRRDGELHVFVVEGPAERLEASQRPVRVGRQSGDFVEITEGAAPGEQVVVEGLFALRDNSPVVIDGTQGSPVGWND